MKKPLFQALRDEIKKKYGLTKNSIDFIPFERWREKLGGYEKKFIREYGPNVGFLKERLGIEKFGKINNQNKKLILFSGIPGAGKTTLSKIIQKSIPNTIIIRGHDIVDLLGLFGKNVNEYRERLTKAGFSNPDPWYISYVYQEKLTRDLLKLGYNVVFDDHIRTIENRMGYLRLANECKADIIFVQINAPFDTYVKREEGKINDEKLKFLSNMVFQSEDFTKDEQKKYSKIIKVDGTKKINEIKRKLISKL